MLLDFGVTGGQGQGLFQRLYGFLPAASQVQEPAVGVQDGGALRCQLAGFG